MEDKSALMYPKPAVNDHSAIISNSSTNVVAPGKRTNKRRRLIMSSANPADAEDAKNRGNA
jgi:hypothetical protein